MTQLQKIGITGLALMLALVILLNLMFDVPVAYSAPFTLPWGAIIIFAAEKKAPKK